MSGAPSDSTRTISLTPGQISYVKRASNRDKSRTAQVDNLFFDHPQLSKDHAEITNDNGVLKIKDTNSSFGTFINNEYVVPNQFYDLISGDNVSFIMLKSFDNIRNKIASFEGQYDPIMLHHFGSPKLLLKFVVSVEKSGENLLVNFLPINTPGTSSSLGFGSPTMNDDATIVVEDFQSGDEVEFVGSLDTGSSSTSGLSSAATIIGSNAYLKSEFKQLKDDLRALQATSKTRSLTAAEEEEKHDILTLLRISEDSSQMSKERTFAMVDYLTRADDSAFESEDLSSSDSEDDEDVDFDGSHKHICEFYATDFDNVVEEFDPAADEESDHEAYDESEQSELENEDPQALVSIPLEGTTVCACDVQNPPVSAANDWSSDSVSDSESSGSSSGSDVSGASDSGSSSCDSSCLVSGNAENSSDSDDSEFDSQDSSDSEDSSSEESEDEFVVSLVNKPKKSLSVLEAEWERQREDAMIAYLQNEGKELFETEESDIDCTECSFNASELAGENDADLHQFYTQDYDDETDDEEYADDTMYYVLTPETQNPSKIGSFVKAAGKEAVRVLIYGSFTVAALAAYGSMRS